MKIVDIACDGKIIAVDKRTGKVDSCDCIICGNCLFDGKHGCNSRRREWADEEPWLIEDLKKLGVVEEYN